MLKLQEYILLLLSIEVAFDEKGRNLEETNAAVKKSYKFLKELGVI
jgi:hypothetical protein